MTTNRLIKTFIILLIVVANISCDQVSKKIVRMKVQPFQTIELLDNHVTLTNVENTGAFLSTGDSLPKTAKKVLLSFLPLFAIMFGLAFILTRPNLSANTVTGSCFIIGGGFGNLIDRMAYGSVTDFLHVHFGMFQTGIFNLADLSIMTGVALIFLQSLRKTKPVAAD